MTIISPSWNKTKKSFLDWLIKSDLKKFFAKNLYYEGLSLWWLTNIYEKDALNNHIWFNDLNKILNNNIKIKPYNNIIFIEILRLSLKLAKILILLSFVKIFYKNNNIKKRNFSNCVQVQFSNLVKYKKNYIDIQFGLFSLKNNNINYLIQFNLDFSLVFNYFKNIKKLRLIPVNYYILNKYISYSEIIKIYIFTFKKFLILNKALRKKNFFIIKKKDCSAVLKPLLIKSFFGQIQFSLLNGTCLRNFNRINRFKNYINYLEFFPSSRAVYYFLKDKSNTNILSINHANYSDNMLAYAIRKSEFSDKKDYLNYSPSPDIFFSQGEKYFKRLKKIFPKKKVYKIGSLKLGIQDINKKNKFKRLIKKEINTKLKIITICSSTHDYLGIVEILNNCDLKSFFIILRPHPYYKKATLNHFEKNFKFKYHLLENFSSRDIIKNSNFIISGDSSLCYESVILGKKNTLRLYNQKFHPLFDYEDGIEIIKNSVLLNKYLINKIKVRNAKPKQLIEKFFYKYDKLAHLRLNKILNHL